MLNHAISASKAGVGHSAQQKQDSAWTKWTGFLKAANIRGCFLEDKNRLEKVGILAAFAFAIRHNHFGRTAQTSLRGDTVRATIAQVGKTFRTHGFADPGNDANGYQHTTIARMIRGFTDADNPTTKQPALALQVFRTLQKSASTHMEQAIADLACGALFFGMRSCEYLWVPGKPSRRKTKKLRLRNLVFRNNGRVIHHTAGLHALLQASMISITFENQKNGEKMETVTQYRSDLDMCPVKFWARIVHRIRGYPNSSNRSHVDAFRLEGTTFAITGDAMRTQLRRAVKLVGEDKLGINTKRVGTHSIRSSFAMMLILTGVPESVIMKKGRWKSVAFLAYIRAHINTFGKDTSTNIAAVANDDFFVIPHFNKIELS